MEREKKIPPVENEVAVYFIIKSDKLRVLLAEHGFYASGHPSLKQSEDGSNHVLKCFHVIPKNIFYFLMMTEIHGRQQWLN